MNIVFTQAPQLMDFQTWVERHDLTLCVHMIPQPDKSKLYYVRLKNNINQYVIAQATMCKVSGKGKTASKAVGALIANLNKCGYIDVPTAWYKAPKFKFVFNQKLLEEAEQELYDTH